MEGQGAHAADAAWQAQPTSHVVPTHGTYGQTDSAAVQRASRRVQQMLAEPTEPAFLAGLDSWCWLSIATQPAHAQTLQHTALPSAAWFTAHLPAAGQYLAAQGILSPPGLRSWLLAQPSAD